LWWLGGLVVVVLAVAWRTGVFPIRSGESIEDVDAVANRYAQLLAGADLEAVDEMVRLTLDAKEKGVTITEAVEGEERCLHWSQAAVKSITSPVSPYHAEVEYFDGTNALTRTFSYSEHALDDARARTWYVVLDDPACAGGTE
jgi:hypothetical protein